MCNRRFSCSCGAFICSCILPFGCGWDSEITRTSFLTGDTFTLTIILPKVMIAVKYRDFITTLDLLDYFKYNRIWTVCNKLHGD